MPAQKRRNIGDRSQEAEASQAMEVEGSGPRPRRGGRGAGVLKAVMDAEKADSAAVQSYGKGHEMGPPGPHRGRALLSALIRHESVAVEVKQELSAFDSRWEKASHMEEVFDDLPHLGVHGRPL